MSGFALILSGCQASLPASKIDPVDATQNLAQPIISVSLCADSYLLALDPQDVGERIAGLSWQAGSELSTLSAPQLDFKKYWNNREILHGVKAVPVLGPGERSARTDAVHLIWGEDFGAVRQNLDLISAKLNVDSTAINAELSALDNLPRPARAPRILYLSRSGGSAGPGTFVDAVIRKAGGVNINAAPGWHTPSLEYVMSLEPDLILTSFFGSDYRGISDRAVRHSALRKFIKSRPRIDIPGKLWPCAGPGLIDAAQRMNEAVLAWDQTQVSL